MEDFERANSDTATIRKSSSVKEIKIGDFFINIDRYGVDVGHIIKGYGGCDECVSMDNKSIVKLTNALLNYCQIKGL